MDAQGEQYAFTKFALGSVHEALQLLDLYTDELPVKVGYALLEYSVVKYFRPFKSSNTRHSFSQPKGPEQKRLFLRGSIVPEQHAEFHKILSEYRDKVYAHFDLDAANVRPAYIKGFGSGFVLALSPVNKLPLHVHIGRMRDLYEAVSAQLSLRVETFESDYLATLPADESY